ncbi:hypothetical protein [Burkholderia sp. LMG 21824]|uniref:hypothetical protein n=1 Tax=Burkholderia sp. LMG 21824 TaxID=3158172 RepID=UPI003C304C6B
MEAIIRTVLGRIDRLRSRFRTASTTTKQTAISWGEGSLQQRLLVDWGYATIGAVTGGGMDAAGQYAQSGTIRPAESVFAGATGAVSGPIGANVGFVNNILLGVAGGVVNSAFNNAYYGE